jgi:hypothetical protein
MLANVSGKPAPQSKAPAIKALEEFPGDVELIDRILEGIDGFIDRLIRRFR